MNYTTILTPSTFPKNSRPIYIRPVADVIHTNKQRAYPQLTTAINRILDEHANRKTLIHTVSYDLATHLHRTLGRHRTDVGMYSSTNGKQRAIESFLDGVHTNVLLAPSLDRGIDLPGDTCRCIIIAKCPYPSLGDHQVSKRLYTTGRDGRLWYAVETIRTIVQMTGRGMRSEDDSCSSYILDSQFVTNIYRKYKSLFPSWWREALIFERGSNALGN